jgi:Zinc-finger of C2H2 type
MTLNDAVVDLFIAACCAALHVSTYINPRFRHVLDSDSTVAALFSLTAFTFCPSLLDVVQSAAAPLLSWFKSLPTDIPKDTWGIYIIVLEKPGYDPLLYIGSGTSSYRGVRVRIGEHHAHKLSPVNIKKALEFGYTITHIALLAYCSIPSPSHRPKIRTIVVALEAVFTAVFWAFVPSEDGNTSRFGLDHMCPWDQDAFEWLGLCSHSSLQESIRCPEGELDFTSEELEDIARLIKEKNAKYQHDYGKAQRTNPTEEFKQQQKARNERHKPKLEQQQQVAIQNKTHYCEPCDVSCRDAASLRRHNGTKGHLLKLEYPDGFICPDCDNKEFQYYSDLQEHFKSKSHQLNAAS